MTHNHPAAESIAAWFRKGGVAASARSEHFGRTYVVAQFGKLLAEIDVFGRQNRVICVFTRHSRSEFVDVGVIR